MDAPYDLGKIRSALHISISHVLSKGNLIVEALAASVIPSFSYGFKSLNKKVISNIMRLFYIARFQLFPAF